MFGTINHFNKTRGFGFIRSAGGSADIYFHHSEFDGDDAKLIKGIMVEFEIGIFKGRLCGRNIRLLGTETTVDADENIGAR